MSENTKSDLPVEVTDIYLIENYNALENQGVSVTVSGYSDALLPTFLHTELFLIITHPWKMLLHFCDTSSQEAFLTSLRDSFLTMLCILKRQSTEGTCNTALLPPWMNKALFLTMVIFGTSSIFIQNNAKFGFTKTPEHIHEEIKEKNHHSI